MFRGFAKQKRELIFAGATLLISIVLITIAVLSLRFLVVSLNGALEEPKVEESQIMKFDLNGFNKLGLAQ